MVIYTIYPPEVVLEPPQSEERKYLTVDCGGRILVLDVTDGQARVARLLSVDPSDYLNPAWQPGAVFGFLPETSGSPLRNRIT